MSKIDDAIATGWDETFAAVRATCAGADRLAARMTGDPARDREIVEANCRTIAVSWDETFRAVRESIF